MKQGNSKVNSNFYRKKYSGYLFGIIGEFFAIIVMTFKGYLLLNRRYKNKKGEIDLIFYKGKTIIFMEVKSRKDFYNHSEIVSLNQIRRMKSAAEAFMLSKKSLRKYPFRFDLFLVKKNLSYVHIKNTFLD